MEGARGMAGEEKREVRGCQVHSWGCGGVIHEPGPALRGRPAAESPACLPQSGAALDVGESAAA